jgi:hypothetical protein
MALGFCAIIGVAENIGIVLGVALIIYFPKVRQEEILLAQKFGEEWNRYVDHTAILFPKKIPQVRSHWSLAQWLHNREYYAFATSLVALVILELIHEFL